MNPRPNSTEDYTTRLVLVVHAFEGGSSRPGLQSEFHISQSYTEKRCFRTGGERQSRQIPGFVFL